MTVICYPVTSQRIGILMPYSLFLPAHFHPGLSDNQILVVLPLPWIELKKNQSRTKQRSLTSPALWEEKISSLLPFNPPQSSTVLSANRQT